MEKIKVLVVDDSALMVKQISNFIYSEEDMVVVDIAKNGEELIYKITTANPDVITLDIEMPKMDGIQTLKELKKKNINIPIIILTGTSREDVETAIKSLEFGVFDFIEKPSGPISMDIEKVKKKLIETIRVAAAKPALTKIYSETESDEYIKPIKIPELITTPRQNFDKRRAMLSSQNLPTVASPKESTASNHKPKTAEKEIVKVPPAKQQNKTRIGRKIDAIVIGTSTGGPKALNQLITALPEKIGVPILVVQHMPNTFTNVFAERLDKYSRIRVKEAVHGETIQKDVVYIAPGGLHMEVSADKKISLNQKPPHCGVRPSVDHLFKSAASIYGSNLLSIILTGMGRDGAEGVIDVKNRGGIVLAEHESTCIVYGMPKAAVETGMVDEIIPLPKMSFALLDILSRNQ